MLCIAGPQDGTNPFGWVMAVFSGFTAGDGTPGNPFRITNAKQLNTVRHHLHKNFILMSDIDLNVAPFNKDSGWVPIGSEQNPFTGRFDGNSHQIHWLYINRNGTDGCGLFGVTRKAVITNLGIVDGSISAGSRVGGIVGYNNDSSVVSRSYFIGTIRGNRSVGGIVGVNGGASGGYECYASADLFTENGYVGDVVGEGAIIHDSYFLGTRHAFDQSTSIAIGRVPLLPEGERVAADYYSAPSLFQLSATNDAFFSSNERSFFSTTQMQKKEFLTQKGWNFDTLWELRENQSFPGLKAINDAPYVTCKK
ncbi:MAG: hypothetical protein JW915_23775 [Chitinispirillaceae bacterium]|nr:hypothetical protein [Chitinispirillaceae bacterium]